MLTSITTALIALAATLAGIAGDTWDKKRHGWRRLTWKGMLVTGIALTAFAFAVVQARNEELARETQRAKDRLVSRAAASAIYDAVHELIHPFNLAAREQHFSDDPKLREQVMFNRFNATRFQYLSDISSGQFPEKLATIRAVTCPREFGPNARCQWADLFVEAAVRADHALGQVINNYSSILSPDTLSILTALRDHRMLGIVKSASGNVEGNRQMGNDVRGITMAWLLLGPHEPGDNYIPFFILVNDLLRRARVLADSAQNAD
jgi:hypothetical protein